MKCCFVLALVSALFAAAAAQGGEKMLHMCGEEINCDVQCFKSSTDNSEFLILQINSQ